MTKDRRTIFKLLIAVLTLLMLACVLVACNIGNSADYYDYLVTFDYNKGNLPGEMKTQQIGVFKNSLVSIRPGHSTDFPENVSRSYYVEGWYLPRELDAEGNPVKDENGFVLLGAKWNFSNQRINQNTTLYANIRKKTEIKFIDRLTGEQIIDSTSKIELIPGQYAYQPNSSAAPKKSGWTFLGKYYKNPTGDEPFSWPCRVGEEDINCYVEYLKGEWRFVSTPADFVRAIQANRNIYLEADIDFGNYLENMLWSLNTYTAELNGRGYKISGVTRNFVASRRDPDNFGGIFGTLGATAYIHNVTFDNINLTFEVNSTFEAIDAYVGIIAFKAEAGARLENVTLSNSTLRYKPNQDHPVVAAALIGDNRTNPQGIINCDYSNNVVVSEIE